MGNQRCDDDSSGVITKRGIAASPGYGFWQFHARRRIEGRSIEIGDVEAASPLYSHGIACPRACFFDKSEKGSVGTSFALVRQGHRPRP
jgi:hypothetical protein